MFLGYDNVVPELAWFPVTFEIQNDGPSFTGQVELSEGGFNRKLRRVVTTELPTGTLKRFTIPMVKAEAYQREWTARLLNEDNRQIAEVSRQLRRRVLWKGLTLGTLARSAAQSPSFPTLRGLEQDSMPAVGRMTPDLFPDNPLVLEGLKVLYLNSERALSLKAPQVNALIGWLWAGGHLVIGLEQVGDLAGAPWLRRLMPAVPEGSKSLVAGPALHQFSTREWPPFPSHRNSNVNSQEEATHPSLLNPDPVFNQAPLPVLGLKAEGAEVVLQQAGSPLVVAAPAGRGRISLLAFNPEREPFASWIHRPWFWASLCGARELLKDARPIYTSRSTDGLIGAMVDSTQIRKLPIGWLLVLLVAYLLVIGPFDRWWLKRINREMLTWVTFPCYVVAFSFLIYLIGYRLRAGDTEWNELQVVDILPFGEQVQLRSRSFGSVYSPANRRFDFASKQPFAGFRAEASPQGSTDSQNGLVEQIGYQFKASVPVPVWTSQLFVHDSMGTNAAPLEAVFDPSTKRLKIINHLSKKIVSAYLVTKTGLYEAKDIAPGSSTIATSEMAFLERIDDFVRSNQGMMQIAADQRRQAFGSDRQAQRLHPPEVALFASFSGLLPPSGEYDNRSFAAPPGMDLSEAQRRGEAILLAWVDNHAAVPGFHQFEPLRHHESTFYRLVVRTGTVAPK